MYTHSLRERLRVVWRLGLTALALIATAGCGGAAAHTPTTTPFPTRAPSSAPLFLPFQDPLLPPDPHNWPNRGGCLFQTDGYHVRGPEPCIAGDFVNAFTDGVISVDAKQLSGPLTQGYSLLFRASHASGPLNFYGFLIDGNGDWRAYKLLGYGEAQQVVYLGPLTQNAAIHTGLLATNTLQVVMSGAHFDFSVNGVKVGQAEDTMLSAGLPGLYGDPGGEVVYTNIHGQFQV